MLVLLCVLICTHVWFAGSLRISDDDFVVVLACQYLFECILGGMIGLSSELILVYLKKKKKIQLKRKTKKRQVIENLPLTPSKSRCITQLSYLEGGDVVGGWAISRLYCLEQSGPTAWVLQLAFLCKCSWCNGNKPKGKRGTEGKTSGTKWEEVRYFFFCILCVSHLEAPGFIFFVEVSPNVPWGIYMTNLRHMMNDD